MTGETCDTCGHLSTDHHANGGCAECDCAEYRTNDFPPAPETAYEDIPKKYLRILTDTGARALSSQEPITIEQVFDDVVSFSVTTGGCLHVIRTRDDKEYSILYASRVWMVVESLSEKEFEASKARLLVQDSNAKSLLTSARRRKTHALPTPTHTRSLPNRRRRRLRWAHTRNRWHERDRRNGYKPWRT